MKKKAIVYLHGFGTLGGLQNRKATFLDDKFAEIESADFYAIDFNPTPKDFEHHTITGMINRLRQFVLMHELETVSLIGISQGADVALNYAARFGGVEKILLLAPELFYDSYISDDELQEWEQLVNPPVFHYGFQKELPLHINHHRDGLNYVAPPEPPCEMMLIHGVADEAVSIERSRAYATQYAHQVILHEVEDGHSLRDSMAFVWEQVQRWVV